MMRLSEIIRVIGGKVVTRTPNSNSQFSILNSQFSTLLTDSRELGNDPAHTLFFALRTDKRDGADFIPELINKGVRAFVVTAPQPPKGGVQETPPLGGRGAFDCCFIQVPDTLQALQDLAAYKRSQYHGTVIGITGSNGKTIVKEWLYQLLKDDYKIVRSPRSYNSQIGVPLSVWQLQDDTTLAIFEAGISQKGEMERLERIIRPTIGVFTSLSEEHGENFTSLDEKRQEKMRLFAHCERVIEDPLHQNVRTCAMVLEALGYDWQTITERLTALTHETVLEVNLQALKHNVQVYRGLLKPTTKLVCMVKAFAYGAGHIEVSRALEQAGVDYLAVAVADEAAELRGAGIQLPIIVMDPEPQALQRIIENNAEPNIYSFQSLRQFVRVAEEAGMEYYPIHLKIDSGMHRLGFCLEDMPVLAEELSRTKAVAVHSVFSHLAAADEPQWDDFTHAQISYFTQCADSLNSQFARHILNSAGIERFTDYQMDMCRLGIGLYGFSVEGKLPLQEVCTLKTTLLSVKTVKAGETIGYGRHTTLTEDRQIAVIPIGYADGFDRRLGNYGGEVLIRQKRCPVVGNVCMDLAMVDVTGTDAQVGDEAIIFGGKLPLTEMATRLGTITYEILTSVSRRVKRVYV